MSTVARPSWRLPGATRDSQSITSDWMPIGSPAIHDVALMESRWVNKSNGRLVELFRHDWFVEPVTVGQIFHVVLNGHRVSAWHVHERTTDRLFVAGGHARVVLYDTRSGSPSYGRIMEILLTAHRPQLVVVPPGIWHGVENADNEPATIVNMPDHAYVYEDPDHWRLPADTSEIPYSFQGTAVTGAVI